MFSSARGSVAPSPARFCSLVFSKRSFLISMPLKNVDLGHSKHVFRRG
jgi:hypothetical protein